MTRADRTSIKGLLPRHERFAAARASGMSASEAYGAAGFRPHRGNASRLSANELCSGAYPKSSREQLTRRLPRWIAFCRSSRPRAFRRSRKAGPPLRSPPA